jgi:5-methylcytosine-specific restriction endonuclease McrA
MSDVLVLNSGFLPLEVISDRDAICLLYKNAAYTVIESDKVMRSPSVTFKVPNVIALLRYGHMPKKAVHFSKLNVLYRDDQTCQYCGKQFPVNKLQIDHVIPKSRWKEVKHSNKQDFTNWFNCVACCKYCNNAKGNMLLEELGWKLLRQPYEPKYLPHLVISYKKAFNQGWLPFTKFNVRLVDVIQ